MLTTHGVIVERRGRRTLDNISINVRPGELVMVLGPNGAGKSTLLRILSGELPPTQGEARLDDVNVTRMPPLQRAQRIAVLPQDHHVAFPFTSLAVATLGRFAISGGVPGADDERAALDALAQTDAAHLADRPYTALSGGEQMRVQLARVLAQIAHATLRQPAYLLLDEPLTALDLAHQHTVLRLVAGLAHDGAVGVVAVLHDVNLALSYADRVLLMQDGRIVVADAPAAALTPDHIQNVFGVSAVRLPHPTNGTKSVLVVDSSVQ